MTGGRDTQWPASLCAIRGSYPERSVASCASVAFDGTSFVVAWRAPAVPGDLRSLNLYGAELSTTGDALRSGGVIALWLVRRRTKVARDAPVV